MCGTHQVEAPEALERVERRQAREAIVRQVERLKRREELDVDGDHLDQIGGEVQRDERLEREDQGAEHTVCEEGRRER